MRIQAYSLSEAYLKASNELGVSAADISIEIISKPSAGFLGFFKKLGEFEASATRPVKKFKDKKNNFAPKNEQKEQAKSEVKAGIKEQKSFEKAPKVKNEPKNDEGVKDENPKEIKDFKKPRAQSNFKAYDNIIDTFNAPDSTENYENSSFENSSFENSDKSQEVSSAINEQMLSEVKAGLKALFDASSFKIDSFETSKYDENTIFIKIDGEDCALLIGKEGYRYKALSYLLYNWLSAKYGVGVRLEIAEFLKNQEVATKAYLEGIINKIEEQGHANTKPLDGVLLKIALEELRARFPNKYVGIKSGDDGKYIVINDFYKK